MEEKDILEGFLFDKNGEFTSHDIELNYISDDYLKFMRGNGYSKVFEVGDLDVMGFELYATDKESELPKFLVHLWSMGAARNQDCLFADDFLSLNEILGQLQPFIHFVKDIREHEEKLQREFEEKESW